MTLIIRLNVSIESICLSQNEVELIPIDAHYLLIHILSISQLNVPYKALVVIHEHVLQLLPSLLFSIFCNPYYLTLTIIRCMRCFSGIYHPTKLLNLSLRLKARDLLSETDIKRNEVFKGILKFGKSTGSWLFEFILHLIISCLLKNL